MRVSGPSFIRDTARGATVTTLHGAHSTVPKVGRVPESIWPQTKGYFHRFSSSLLGPEEPMVSKGISR